VPGHYLANAGLFASTSYGGSQYGGQKGDLASTEGSEGTWGQEIYYGPTPSAIREDAAAAGITLGTLGTALHKDIVYMLDAFKGTISLPNQHLDQQLGHRQSQRRLPNKPR
jgi:hypothetical protein